jgi:HSP20 family protein
MTLYISPTGRVWRRRWSQPYRDNDYPEAESEVFVPINVKGDENEYVITALLPGLKPDDLSIQVINETVTLQGTIKDASGDEEPYLLRESPTGRFYRVVRLPEALDANKAEADLTDGVLTLRVPKAEEARPRMIKVKTA